MQSGRFFTIAAAVATAIVISACGKREEPPPAPSPQVLMPEVNLENCRKIDKKALPDGIREKFARGCLYLSTYRPSDPDKW